MIDCMTLDQMAAFVAILGDIATVYGDYDAVRIDAETATTWWFREPQTSTAATGAPTRPVLCMSSDAIRG